MNRINKSKRTTAMLLLIVSALMVAAVRSAYASPQYTYTFEGSSPSVFDGSTITIDNTGGSGVVSFDIDGYTSYLTLLNENISTYAQSGWSGDFKIYVGSAWDIDATGTSLEIYNADIHNLVSGTWSVPDESSTFPLLLSVLGALAGASGYRGLRCTAARAR